jgi:predicted transcriptional regulator
MKPTSVALPSELTARIDSVARQSDRSRSYVVRKLLENALTGADRLRALEEIAAAGVEENAAKRAYRVRGPNPGQVIAESATDGHARLAAMGKIAKGASDECHD